MPVKCAACGESAPERYTYCPHCGKPFPKTSNTAGVLLGILAALVGSQSGDLGGLGQGLHYGLRRAAESEHSPQEQPAPKSETDAKTFRPVSRNLAPSELALGERLPARPPGDNGLTLLALSVCLFLCVCVLLFSWLTAPSRTTTETGHAVGTIPTPEIIEDSPTPPPKPKSKPKAHRVAHHVSRAPAPKAPLPKNPEPQHDPHSYGGDQPYPTHQETVHKSSSGDYDFSSGTDY